MENKAPKSASAADESQIYLSPATAIVCVCVCAGVGTKKKKERKEKQKKREENGTAHRDGTPLAAVAGR